MIYEQQIMNWHLLEFDLLLQDIAINVLFIYQIMLDFLYNIANTNKSMKKQNRLKPPRRNLPCGYSQEARIYKKYLLVSGRVAVTRTWNLSLVEQRLKSVMMSIYGGPRPARKQAVNNTLRLQSLGNDKLFRFFNLKKSEESY